MFVPLVSLAGLGQTYTTAQIQQMIVAQANTDGVPPAIALGVAAHESNFQPSAQNPNSSAAGLYQLLNVTQTTLGVTNALDPTQSIQAGVGLLAQYYAQYGNWTTALYAYADGPGAVASPGYQPSAMAQQFASYVTSYSPPAGLDLGTAVASTASSLASSLGLESTDDSGDTTILGLSTDPASSSSLAQSLGLSDAELGIGAAVVGLLAIALLV